jgi:hypothetical protein
VALVGHSGCGKSTVIALLGARNSLFVSLFVCFTFCLISCLKFSDPESEFFICRIGNIEARQFETCLSFPKL